MSDFATRSAAGRLANEVGGALQSFLDGHHERALARGVLAHIDKIDPPAIRRKGEVLFGPRTVADYVGMLDGGGGRYFAAEAKSTKLHYLPKAELTTKQQEHLDAVAAAGGLALLVAEFRGEPGEDVLGILSDPRSQHVRAGLIALHNQGRRRYACPWQAVRWQVLKTAPSVAEVDLLRDGWAISGDCYLERFHPRGTPSSPPRTGRVYAAE